MDTVKAEMLVTIRVKFRACLVFKTSGSGAQAPQPQPRQPDFVDRTQVCNQIVYHLLPNSSQ